MRIKQKPKKALLKRIKITGSGKIMRSHQLRTGHLRRRKSKSALRRHQVPVALDSGMAKRAKRLLAI